MSSRKKTVLITGVSSGLGYEMSKIFLSEGWEVIGISRNKTDLQIKSVIADLGKISQLKKALESGLHKQSIDLVILNAGTLGKLNPQHFLSLDDYYNSMNINVFSNKIILDEILHKRRLSPRLVLGISSGASRKTYFGWGTYCVSKAAFNQLLSSYGDEYKETNFVSLSPGPIRTKMQDSIQREDPERIPSVKKFQSLYETMRKPEEIANKIFKNLEKLTVYKDKQFLEIDEISDLTDL